MTDLSDLCDELHEQLRSDECWSNELKSFVLSHAAVFNEAKRRANLYRYVDDSLDCEVFAHAIIAEGWLRLKKPPSDKFCVGEIRTMLQRWALRVPGRRGHWRTGPKVLPDSEAIDQMIDPDYSVIEVFESKLLLAAVLGWIRKFAEPARTIAMMRIEQQYSNKEIAEILKLSPSATSESWKNASIKLKEKIRLWREEDE